MSSLHILTSLKGVTALQVTRKHAVHAFSSAAF